LPSNGAGSLVGAFMVRFYYVNRNVALPIMQEFAQGEIVPFGDDFCAAEDSASGYTLQARDILFPTAGDGQGNPDTLCGQPGSPCPLPPVTE